MKTTRFIRIFCCLLLISLSLSSHVDAAKKKKRKSSSYPACRAVILSDSTAGQRLYGKNVNTRVLPASTTKVLTALLVLEKLSLDSYVTVRPGALGVQPTKIHVRQGERFKVRDLLYAILLHSANDASIVLAQAVAGSEYNFVQLMNQKARQLGASNTRFANSNGLPSARGTQYTTAYDMYLIFRAALKHDFFRQAIRIQYKTIYSANGRQIHLKSHNRLLFQKSSNKMSGKTGYTRAAGACFVGTVQKGKNTLIVGVFGCHDRWGEIKRVVSRYGGVRL